MSERTHAAVTDQKIKRRREQGERRETDHEIDQRLARENQRYHGQDGEGGGAEQNIECERTPPHRQAISLPNRPVGRAIKTSTMNRYISPSVNSGKPRLPNERMRPMASAATNALTIEPRPPMTARMNHTIRMQNTTPR